ncbi:glycogen debranching enzyme [Endobacter medicaginis]|uniref:Amylo-alpha-1,6-glucosidase n=1 Tax=Endobacter medicaginis TaxID=1181271 RepID=A0A839URC9_9PROT|nr:amylo-alpha-1,6-glucosidase [Endobacter medicaginis]MBB3172317.1 glycogen debranching enzyme [Endobacter medicaginis]MCX5474564.1 amylo-alpha-1,6-glucosidase [Endobacter medicaginis]NVN30696.1 amylo-alpha-1,6-glucosidase [Endobacter medicaginis]
MDTPPSSDASTSLAEAEGAVVNVPLAPKLSPGKPDDPLNDLYPVSAADLGERALHPMKSGDTFGVFDQAGNVLQGPDIADGLYHRDTRYLSALNLAVCGARPILLSGSVREDNAMLTCDFTNPDLTSDDGSTVAHDLLHLRRNRFLWHDTCFDRLLVRNFDVRHHEITITIVFAADFADLFEARGTKRARHGTHNPPVVGTDQVELSYTGLDDLTRTTRIRFHPAPTRLDAKSATFRLSLAQGERALIYTEIACNPEGRPAHAPDDAFLFSMVEMRRDLRISSARAAAIATTNEIFNEAIRRCVCDIYMLVTNKPTGPFPYAGVPWYSTAFGRDAIITALLMLWMDPSVARGVLTYLAANQADREDPIADAEPGKILHEVRHGEMAELGEVPFRRYYGSVDSTPLFVMLAGEYLNRTGDVATIAGLWPNIERALSWIDKYGDRDGDGFVEYGRRNDNGLVNQGWKDSFDSIFHADGTLAEGPIALVEVQGYVYAAKRAGAQIGRRLGHATFAERLDAEAETLKHAFNAAFWIDEIGTYAIALDGKKRPCKVRSSNAGHTLATGIATQARGEMVAHQLLGLSFFSGWGVRTIAMGEARYNPMSYHNGSVWPHDNALIAQGLARYGFKDEAAKLFGGLFAGALSFNHRRLPELFCGFARQRGENPVRYPVACEPQAWAAATIPALIQATLGLRFEPSTTTVHFDRPSLPDFLDEMTLYNLRIDDESKISVVVRRIAGEVAISVLERTGPIKLRISA